MNLIAALTMPALVLRNEVGGASLQRASFSFPFTPVRMPVHALLYVQVSPTRVLVLHCSLPPLRR